MVTGDSALQSQTLERLASAVNYHAWLTDLAVPHLGDHPLELGSGLGDYATSWLGHGVPRITVTEADESRLHHLTQRFRDDDRVTVRAIDITSPWPAEHSAYVGFNVLEHIPDHVGALRAAHSLVRPGGAVVMFVPAFQVAMSRFDRRVGHVRRYRTSTLSAAYSAAGLAVEDVRYVNAPGLLAWLVGMRLLRLTPQDGWPVKLWDRLVIPAVRRAESRVSPPFGQSVLAVGRVP